MPQKLLVPLFLLIGGGVAGVVVLLDDVYKSDDMDGIVDKNGTVPHSCIDPTRVMTLMETEFESADFWPNLYHTLITVTSVALPLLIIPPTLVVATVRSCLHGHCCQIKYKQSAGQ